MKAGDDEGAFIVSVSDSAKRHVLSTNFMVSDTSEYPKEHSFFCHSDDEDISSRFQSLIERVVDERSRTIKDLVDWFTAALAKAVTSSKAADSE